MCLTSQKSKPKHHHGEVSEGLSGSKHVACEKRSIEELERSNRVLLRKQVTGYNFKEGLVITERKSDSVIVL
jgi:hypothetical protein